MIITQKHICLLLFISSIIAAYGLTVKSLKVTFIGWCLLVVSIYFESTRPGKFQMVGEQ